MKGKLKKQDYGWAIEYMAYDEIYGSSQELYPLNQDQAERIHSELVDLERFYDFEVTSTAGAVINDFHLIPQNWVLYTVCTLTELGESLPIKVMADLSEVSPDKLDAVVAKLNERYKEIDEQPISRYVRL